jgi:hypothetical protein
VNSTTLMFDAAPIPIVSGARTTTNRRFGHARPNILWLGREIFLTSFPQPPILRSQTRGKVRRLFRNPSSSQGTERTGFNRILRGDDPTSHRATIKLARLSWAFPFFQLRGAEKATLHAHCPVAFWGSFWFLLGTQDDARTPTLGVKWMEASLPGVPA